MGARATFDLQTQSIWLKEMDTVPANSPAQITYALYDFDGSALADDDITALTYSVYDVTNEAEVRAATSITLAASGTIALSASDTLINGTGRREQRRVCLNVNNGEIFGGMTFYVASNACEPSA